MNRLWITVAAATSAVLLYLGTGLEPVPAIACLGLLPILLASSRCTARETAATAFVAWLLATSNEWAYFHHQLEMPVIAVAAYTVAPAALFAAAVSLFRVLVRRSAVAAAVGFAALWTGVEYVASLLTPHGAFWSLAYTFTDVPLVLQLAAVTGPWGITFLIMVVPASVAAAFRGGLTARGRVATVSVAAVAIGLTVGYGVIPTHVSGPTVRVGLISVPQPERPISMPDGAPLLRSYVDGIEDLARRGATIVVAPEKVFAVDTTTLPSIVDPLSRLARRYQLTVVMGLQYIDTANVALAITGSSTVRYDKHHLIPGLEDSLHPGANLSYVDGYALTVCKDMDFPSLMRDIGGAGLVLAPSWDFGSDGWLHSRMAVMRGVEEGFSIARPARNGRLVVSDATGHIIAESSAAATTTVLSDVPTASVTTTYERFADWFAWLCLALVASLLVPRTRRRLEEKRARPSPTSGLERPDMVTMRSRWRFDTGEPTTEPPSSSPEPSPCESGNPDACQPKERCTGSYRTAGSANCLD